MEMSTGHPKIITFQASFMSTSMWTQLTVRVSLRVMAQSFSSASFDRCAQRLWRLSRWTFSVSRCISALVVTTNWNENLPCLRKCSKSHRMSTAGFLRTSMQKAAESPDCTMVGIAASSIWPRLKNANLRVPVLVEGHELQHHVSKPDRLLRC